MRPGVSASGLRCAISTPNSQPPRIFGRAKRPSVPEGMPQDAELWRHRNPVAAVGVTIVGVGPFSRICDIQPETSNARSILRPEPDLRMAVVAGSKGTFRFASSLRFCSPANRIDLLGFERILVRTEARLLSHSSPVQPNCVVLLDWLIASVFSVRIEDADLCLDPPRVRYADSIFCHDPIPNRHVGCRNDVDNSASCQS